MFFEVRLFHNKLTTHIRADQVIQVYSDDAHTRGNVTGGVTHIVLKPPRVVVVDDTVDEVMAKIRGCLA